MTKNVKSKYKKTNFDDSNKRNLTYQLNVDLIIIIYI